MTVTWDLIGGALCGQQYRGDAELLSVALPVATSDQRHVYAVERDDDQRNRVLRFQGVV